MAELNLQDEFESFLIPRGFARENKVFRRSTSGGLAMEVWLNPENRLKRVATVCVDVALAPDDPGGPLYTFDQANHAQVLERGGRWQDSRYTPQLPGWPRVIVDDFVRYTVPFIDMHRSPADLCESLLSARIAPDGFAPTPLKLVQWAWEIARRAGLSRYEARALKSLSLLRMDEDDYSTAMNWMAHVGIKNVQLLQPVRRPNRVLRRLGVKGSREALPTFPGFAERWQNRDGDPFVRAVRKFLSEEADARSFVDAYCELWNSDPQRDSDERGDILGRLNDHLFGITDLDAVDDNELQDYVAALTWIGLERAWG